MSAKPETTAKEKANVQAAERKTLEIFRGLRDKLEETRKP